MNIYFSARQSVGVYGREIRSRAVESKSSECPDAN